jgi:hypothetical protein
MPFIYRRETRILALAVPVENAVAAVWFAKISSGTMVYVKR